MSRLSLAKSIQKKKSMLCVGLDTDLSRIPLHIRENYDDPIVEFNRKIIAATSDMCVAYKFNIAFYEANGVNGWNDLEKSLALVPDDILTIADAKRGDIGNTSSRYAHAFLRHFDFDAITVAPYMGEDSLRPFFEFDDKWVIILGLTSNTGSLDFQMLPMANGEYLFETVLKKCSSYGTPDNTMFVVGATQTEYLKRVRDAVPDHFLLVPGIGAQGGDLPSTIDYGLNDHYGLLINSSRGIIYADTGQTFDLHARAAARSINEEFGALVNFSLI